MAINLKDMLNSFTSPIVNTDFKAHQPHTCDNALFSDSKLHQLHLYLICRSLFVF